MQRLAFIGILLLAGGTRLYHINVPSMDFLAWRECQTLMVARNFYRHSMNPFTPAVDWRTTDRVVDYGVAGGTELQLVPYLTAGLYHLFGTEPWTGRLIPIVFSIAGIVYFHALAAKRLSPPGALTATLLLAVSPYYLYCGRLQMPEAMVFMAAFAALYHYERWLQTDHRWDYAIAMAWTALMLLGKPQMGIFAIPMFALTWQRYGWRFLLRPSLYLFAAITGGLLGSYMMYSYSVLIPKTGLSFAQPDLLNYALLLEPAYYKRLAHSLCTTALTPVAAVLGVMGLILWFFQRDDLLTIAWLAGALAFFLSMPGGNNANGYYHLMLVPPVCLLAGRAGAWGFAGRRWTRWAAAGVVLVAAAYSLDVAHRMFKPWRETAYNCGTWVRKHTPQDALVLTASASPVTLYHADRIGWICWKEHYGKDIEFDAELINRTRRLGASILAIPDPAFENLFYPEYWEIRDRIYDTYQWLHTDGFTVFDLEAPADLSFPEAGRIEFGTPGARQYLRGTWGPNDADSNGQPVVVMGPAQTAGVRVEINDRARWLVLEAASLLPDQQLRVLLNGKTLGVYSLPMTPDTRRIHLPTRFSGANALTFEVARQTAEDSSILLYSLKDAQLPSDAKQ